MPQGEGMMLADRVVEALMKAGFDKQRWALLRAFKEEAEKRGE